MSCWKWMMLTVVTVGVCRAQETRRDYDPVHVFSGFAGYSNDSSHILIGQSEARKLLTLGVSYERRLKGNAVATWRWEFDVRPLVLLRNPVLTTDETVTAIPGVTPASVAGPPPGVYHSVNLEKRECASGAGSGSIYGTAVGGTSAAGGMTIPVETYRFTSVCSHPWTYGGAVSPLGQKVNFRPLRRLQPYVAANAGFLAFSEVTPSDNATKFNFSFEVGAGFQYYLRRRQAVSVDYRYHHISNAYTGMENPGVDSGVVKVAYSFGR